MTHCLRRIALTAATILALATPAIHADIIAFAAVGNQTTPMAGATVGYTFTLANSVLVS